MNINSKDICKNSNSDCNPNEKWTGVLNPSQIHLENLLFFQNSDRSKTSLTFDLYYFYLQTNVTKSAITYAI